MDIINREERDRESPVIACPDCGSGDGQVKAGRVATTGSQRYKCSHCRRRYTVARRPRGYSAAIRAEAITLYEQGISAREIGRRLEIDPQSVANWLRERNTAAPDEPVASSATTVVSDTLPPGEPLTRRATIEDVARVARVSTATVSNFLNGKTNMGADTRQRVQTAIDTLHFTPSALVRAIRQRRTHILGVLLFGLIHMDRNPGRTMTVPVLAGINEAAYAANYRVLLYPDLYHPQPLHHGIPFLDGHIDGLLWVAPRLEEPVLEQVTRAGLPVVAVLSRHVPDTAGYVNADNIAGVRQMVAYLHGKGHTRIAYIGPAHSSNCRDRLFGYREGLEVCGLPHDPALEFPMAEDRFIEYRRDPAPYLPAVEQCLSLPAPPTAIVTPSDDGVDIVAGMLRARGIQVPDQIAVTGFDGVSDATYRPHDRVTTLRQPFHRLGQVAVENLLRRIAGESAEQCRTTLPVEFLPGDTA